ncbi:MAG TPA: hypothetical protein VJ850_08995 [Candidatus Limnocylindrales bacterium]|nr:hypothetical protein [Candidatus Limnocylindrales bacterium]
MPPGPIEDFEPFEAVFVCPRNGEPRQCDVHEKQVRHRVEVLHRDVSYIPHCLTHGI